LTPWTAGDYPNSLEFEAVRARVRRLFKGSRVSGHVPAGGMDNPKPKVPRGALYDLWDPRVRAIFEKFPGPCRRSPKTACTLHVSWAMMMASAVAMYIHVQPAPTIGLC